MRINQKDRVIAVLENLGEGFFVGRGRDTGRFPETSPVLRVPVMLRSCGGRFLVCIIKMRSLVKRIPRSPDPNRCGPSIDDSRGFLGRQNGFRTRRVLPVGQPQAGCRLQLAGRAHSSHESVEPDARKGTGDRLYLRAGAPSAATLGSMSSSRDCALSTEATLEAESGREESEDHEDGSPVAGLTEVEIGLACHRENAFYVSLMDESCEV